MIAQFEPDELLKKIAEDKVNKIITLLEDVPDVMEKAFILAVLVHSFEDISGIDVHKVAVLNLGEKE